MRALAAFFLADESGATTTEYALIATGIAIAIAASLNAIINTFSGVLANW